MTLPIHFAIIAVLLGLSAVFSGSETAIFSLSRIQVKRIKDRKPERGKVVERLLNSPRRTLNIILTGNMLVNVTASALLTVAMVRMLGGKGVGVAVGAMTFLVLIFGEVTPKSFAIRNAESISSLVSKPLDIFGKITFPIRWILATVADVFISFFVGKKYTKKPFATEEELKTLVSIGEREGIVDKDEKHMIHAVFEFSHRHINEIMVPRVDIVAVNYNQDCKSLAETLKASRHSKLPVYIDNIDNIQGVIYTKQYLLDPKEDWRSFIRPVMMVPESKTIEDLLIEFRSKKQDIAIAVDEYGGTSGLVTVEDIIEEIVGEIVDEYDREEEPIRKIDDKTFRLMGDLTLNDLHEELGIDLETEEAETVGGFLMQKLGKIPRPGDTLAYKNLLFLVEDVRKNRIRRITMKRAA
jgi:CBS domain containing-hemolysin-like protein